MAEDAYYYARNHDAGPGQWCVRGPNGFQMYLPDLDKNVAYIIGKLLSGNWNDARRMLDDLAGAKSSIATTLSKLDGLYAKTEEDWVLEVHHMLTEPTCPSARIAREDSNALRYTVARDTIEEAIEAAVDLVHREIILGETIEIEWPMTNPDDHR
jgi:hypothetical protein